MIIASKPNGSSAREQITTLTQRHLLVDGGVYGEVGR